MTEDIIMDRIFKYFNTECQDDIDLEEWITGFNVILKGNAQTGFKEMCVLLNIPGSLSEQTLYCFSIYDLNEDGYISREEMLTMMGSCLSKVKGGQEDTEEDEGIKDLMEMTLKRMDHDKDGKISHEDFSKTVTQDVLMLEAFGSCLPSGRAGQEFVSSILDAKIV